MLNVNHLLRELNKLGLGPFSHKDVNDLLSGVKGKFTKKDIKQVRRLINNSIRGVDGILNKLENE